MDDFGEKIEAILRDPGMMQQIMTMAQSLSSPNAPEPPGTTESALPALDPAMIQKIFHILQRSGIDPEQQALLHALSPYLTKDRIEKLEKAMRAAKLAGLASAAMESSGFRLFSGR